MRVGNNKQYKENLKPAVLYCSIQRIIDLYQSYLSLKTAPYSCHLLQEDDVRILSS